MMFFAYWPYIIPKEKNNHFSKKMTLVKLKFYIICLLMKNRFYLCNICITNVVKMLLICVEQ